jgi:hypothetical protein
VTASLLTIASNRGLPAGDKFGFLGRVAQTLQVTRETFDCAYESRSGCVFFDEKMARLDYNIYKLALSVLITSETTTLISNLQKELVPQIPVLGPTVDATVSAVKAAGHAALAASQTSEVVDNLISLGYNTANTLAPLFPLYRDAQELDMVVILDTLARRCVSDAHIDTGQAAFSDKNRPLRERLDDYLSPQGVQKPTETPCMDFRTGMSLYIDGNGDLKSWRQFTKSMAEVYIYFVTPTDEHFIQVSKLIANSCDQIFGQMGVSAKAANVTIAGASAGAGVALGCKDLVLFNDRVSPPAKGEAAATKVRTRLDDVVVEHKVIAPVRSLKR